MTGKSVVCNFMCRLKSTLFAIVYGATVAQVLHALLGVHFFVVAPCMLFWTLLQSRFVLN